MDNGVVYLIEAHHAISPEIKTESINVLARVFVVESIEGMSVLCNVESG
jgi:hypothetical protein